MSTSSEFGNDAPKATSQVDELNEVIKFAEEVSSKIQTLRNSILSTLFFSTLCVGIIVAGAYGLLYVSFMGRPEASWIVGGVVAFVAVLAGGFYGYDYLTSCFRAQRQLRVEKRILDRLLSMCTSLLESVTPNVDPVTRALIDMRLSRIRFSDLR
jgi:hypothetical protein